MTTDDAKGMRCSKCADAPLIVSPNAKGAMCRCPDCELLKIKDLELTSLRTQLSAAMQQLGEVRGLIIQAYMRAVGDCPDDKYFGRCPTKADAEDAADEIVTEWEARKK